MKRSNWTRDELILAFNLYCKTPFGKIHNRNPEIISLSKILQRTPSALSWKLANFARLDPSLKKRSIQGASHGGKGEIDIWNEFNNDWESLSFESEILLARKKGEKPHQVFEKEDAIVIPKGKERETIVKVRINQNFFRATVLAAYRLRCCITGIAIPALLNASHIKPWALDIENRVNPHNGLCLNSIHDRAFDRGLLTILPDYKIKISSVLQKQAKKNNPISEFFIRYDGTSIQIPDRFLPDSNFLKYHNSEIFKP